jgi:hypothetical protein
MMHGITNRRGIVASMLCVLSACASGALAQVQQPPSAQDAFAALTRIQTWLDAWRVPSENSDGAFVPAPAASVELRLDGRLIGRGSSATAPTCLNAVQHAMDEARSRLPVRNDALLQQNLREHARRAAISVELAGGFVPLRSQSIEAINLEAQMGIEGIAVRIGSRVEAMFPSMMLATATSPGMAASILIRRLRPDVVPFVADEAEGLVPDDLILDNTAIVYRFRTIHVAQPAPGRPATVLTRGGHVVEVAQITSDALVEMATRMARHLIDRRWPEGEALGMVGTVHPGTGRSEPVVASAYEQAMAAAALRRFARMRGVGPRAASDAEAAAIAILADLAVVESIEAAPWDDAASSAMCIIAATQGGRPRDLDARSTAMLERCADSVRAAFSVDNGFAPDLPPAARGDIALALTRLALETGNAIDREAAQSAIRRSLIDAGPGGLPMLLPWIGFAEVELAGDRPIPAAIALRDARDLVWEHQMTPADVGDDTRDFMGGIVFTRTGSMVPNWQSAKPIAFLARMLGDERLTEPDEMGVEIIRMVRAMRFLRQLMADRYVGYRYANPIKATGGVRSSLFDDRMPAPATALSLIAACETVDSLHRLTQGRR